MSSSSVTFLYSESGCVWSHTQTRGVLNISVYSILLPLGSVSLIPKTTSARFSSMVFTKWEEKKVCRTGWIFGSYKARSYKTSGRREQRVSLIHPILKEVKELGTVLVNLF